MPVLYHKRRIVHLIFQISNAKCSDKTGYPRPGHIYKIYITSHNSLIVYVLHLMHKFDLCMYISTDHANERAVVSYCIALVNGRMAIYVCH